MKKNKTKYWILGIVSFIVLAFSFWWWRSSLKPNPEADPSTPQAMVNNTANEAKAKMAKLTMESASMSITGIKGDNIEVQNKVIIKNPLPVGVNLTGLDYVVKINGVKAAEGHYPTPIHLPASGSQTVTLPMSVSAKAIDAVNDKLQQQNKDTALYTFVNTVHTDLPIAGERKFNVTIEEELPMVWLPEMKPGDLDIKKFTLKNAGLKMTMHVTNPNSFAIRMKDGRYSMSIDGKNTMNGEMQEVVVLPAKKTVPVAMFMSMKTGSALKMGWKALFDKKDTKYKLKFDSQILSNEKMLKNASVHFKDEGTLDKLMKAVKNQ
jgi:LEA14-like dessication related protein